MKRLGLVAQLLAVAPLLIGGSAQAALVSMDIGTPGDPLIPGSFSYDPATDTYTVNGGGTDIWDNDDHFHFVYEEAPLFGDATIIARVKSLDVTNSWSKAGVMIRDQLTETSTHAQMVVSGDPRVSFQYRPFIGGSSSVNTGGIGVRPYWIKLTRVGDTFTGYHSPDGLNWTEQGSIDIFMLAPYIGLAVTSHDNNQIAQATFDYVRFSDPAEMTWDGSDPNNWGSDHWNAAGAFPDNWTIATVNSGHVDVMADRDVFALEMTGGTVDINPGNKLSVVAAADAGGGTISLGAGSTFEIQSGGGAVQNLVTNGNATISVAGTLVAGSLSDGGTAATITFDGAGTVRADSVTAQAGTVFKLDQGTLAVSGASPLGASTQAVQLNGGTFDISGEEALTSGYLRGSMYVGGPRNNDLIDGIGDGTGTGGLLGETPIQSVALDGRIDFRNDGDFRAVFTELSQNDDYKGVFFGKFHAPEDGNYEFGVNRSDDSLRIYLDLNQDGVFDTAAGELVVTRQCCGSVYNNTVALTAGQTYDYLVAHHEYGGGSSVEPTIQLPSWGSRQTVEPGAAGQAGLWSGMVVQEINEPLDFVVTQDSAIRASTDIQANLSRPTWEP